MSRYLIERNFPEGLSISQDKGGTKLCGKVIDNNAEDGVTWVYSYVTPDRKRTSCIYDGPTPEAVRRAAARNKLPHLAAHRDSRSRSVFLQIDSRHRPAMEKG
jgi:hypothetical protein